jgi:F-type H+-transporting ATPase subunit 8
MPQLVPFYFTGEFVITFIIIMIILNILSKYILPVQVRIFLSRIFITKI